jgi:hypothetical protein
MFTRLKLSCPYSASTKLPLNTVWLRDFAARPDYRFIISSVFELLYSSILRVTCALILGSREDEIVSLICQFRNSQLRVEDS